ncbi:TonB-dependent receptor [Brumimicrobium aurantiacum]|uniref:TonB-dependent receptor n=1 Tax=Brumimicrobium aurantiacum TaxID=1737063 RepID=A0A3E1F1B6_9FLAO|nr:TonB-dependent receptor [Brumimicrobium aurantiacum]RFC55621.1 TonB-dependent receptor [Brumimicrobium aurantiacum]
MKAKLGIFIYLVFSFHLYSQEFEGKVIDKKTKEVIPFAKVGFPDINIFTSADAQGSFMFKDLPKSHLTLKATAFNYEVLIQEVDLTSNSLLLIKMTPLHTVFEEVKITASEGRIQRENITSITVATKDELFQTGATTLGESLNSIPGVQSSSVGMGITKPVIRGLSGMRVVTYNNGLRIENQQWGSDHGMAASELGLGNVEVVKGPSSLLYGADALGGVIHFIDEPYIQKGKVDAYVSSKFESNSMGTKNEVGFRVHKDNWRANVYANYLNHADFQLPDGGFIKNSRFWGTNFKTSLGYRKNNYQLNIRYQMSYLRLGIPGHSHNENPQAIDFISNERVRAISLPVQYNFNNFLLVENTLFFNRSKLLVSLGNTNNDLQEYDEKVTKPFTHLNVNNSTYNIKYDYKVTEKINLKTGVQGMVKINRNRFPTSAFLIPDANTIDNGVFALMDYEVKKWRFQGGIRYDVRNLNILSTEDQDSSLTTNINTEALERTFHGLNYSAGFVRNSKRTSLRFNASSGYRAPHVSELRADGFHHGSLRYEKGDENLEAEHALQLDLAFELHFDHFEFIINPYYNRIRNFIYLNQSDEFAGSFPIFEYGQTALAHLYGGEVGFHYHPHSIHRLHINSTFSVTIAETEDGTPISLIPQPNINSSIRFDVNNKNKFKVKNIILEHQYFLPQNRVGINETTSIDYHLLNLSTQFVIGNAENLSFSTGVRNLLNTDYQGHLSSLKNLGLSQPGINAYLSVIFKIK